MPPSSNSTTSRDPRRTIPLCGPKPVGGEKSHCVAPGQGHPRQVSLCLSNPPIPHARQRWSSMNKLRVLVVDDNEVMRIPHKVKIFRLNPFDWWAGYDLKSVKLAYVRETGA